MQPNLKKAFETTMIDRIINDVPEMPDHVFSEEFEKKMRELIYGKKFRAVHRSTKQRIFTYIMVAIIAAVITACSVEPFREFFKKFFMEVFGTHTTVQTFSDNINTPTSIKDVYMINVPNGFDIVYKDDIFEWSPFIAYIYRKDNDYIFFNQFLKSEYDVNINTENRPLDYIEINGNDGYIVDLGNNEYYISWDNGDYIFDITGNISKDELIKVANSVQKVE